MGLGLSCFVYIGKHGRQRELQFIPLGSYMKYGIIELRIRKVR
jgi:hypothetical protein